jgi:hypothetical protein
VLPTEAAARARNDRDPAIESKFSHEGRN